ncbi:MAG: Gldg family protein [Gammaproteobacteria bacterium]
MHEHAVEWAGLAWALGWAIALGMLFAWGMSLPLIRGRSAGRRRLHAALVAAGGGAVAVLAIAALTLHDTQLDLTREHLHTPAAQALAVARALTRPVQVTYYYQGSDPNARRALDMLRRMAAENPLLEVRGVDPDKQPSLARTAGVKLYNAALIESDERKLLVHSTDEREFAIGIQRALRERRVEFCFVEGHRELPVENREFRNEVESLGAHAHDDPASMVIETSTHGVGRWRRSLLGLGYDVTAIALASGAGVPARCSAVVVAGPRRPFAPAESVALRRYLAAGGAAILLLDVGYVLDADLAGLVAELGVVAEDAVVVDPVSHYGTDVQTVAVTGYADHPITRRVGYTYFPGVRPLRIASTPAVAVTSLVETSAAATLATAAGDGDRKAARRVVAAASLGRLAGASDEFRALLVGDVDFLANEHYPQMSNSELALAMARWLVREDELVATSPHVHATPLVMVTDAQLKWLYLGIVLLMPLAAVAAGGLVGWRRR